MKTLLIFILLLLIPEILLFSTEKPRIEALGPRV